MQRMLWESPGSQFKASPSHKIEGLVLFNAGVGDDFQAHTIFIRQQREDAAACSMR
jgi:hypothetical protein